MTGVTVLWLDVPVLVEDEVKGREREFLHQQGGKLFLNGPCPAADKDDESIDSPGDAAARSMGEIARKVLLAPHVPVI